MTTPPFIAATETGIALHLPIGVQTACAIALFLGIVLASALIWALLPRTGTTNSRGAWIDELSRHAPRGIVIAGAILWTVLLFVVIAGLLWTIAQTGLRIGGSAQQPLDLRWYLLTITALTAALGAVVALPFTLVRMIHSARQTATAEQSHITDQITAAVLGLGAEKEVNRLGRQVTLKAPVGAAPVITFEWQDEPLPDDAERLKTGDWSNYALTRPNLEVRIGAILSLERIAQKSDEDHVRIMEILCAYIRENTRGRTDPDPPQHGFPEEDSPEAEGFDYFGRGCAYRYELAEWRATLQVRTDIQTALNVLGQRSDAQRELEAAANRKEERAEFVFTDFPEPPEHDDATADWHAFRVQCAERKRKFLAYDGYRMDLRGADLNGYDLAGGNWDGTRFHNARLQGANLRAARLKGADLSGARLQGADLKGAWLHGAGLEGAKLQGADLKRARLQGAVLEGAQSQGADLRGAWLQGADLGWAELQGADVRNACLQEAALWKARLQGANLVRARLQEADLRSARLQGVDFGWARLQGADLGGARLQGAELGGTEMDATTSFSPATLRGAGLRKVDFAEVAIQPGQLDEVFGDATVKLPEGITLHPDAPTDRELDDQEWHDEWRAWQARHGYDKPAPG